MESNKFFATAIRRMRSHGASVPRVAAGPSVDLGHSEALWCVESAFCLLLHIEKLTLVQWRSFGASKWHVYWKWSTGQIWFVHKLFSSSWLICSTTKWSYLCFTLSWALAWFIIQRHTHFRHTSPSSPIESSFMLQRLKRIFNAILNYKEWQNI